QRVLCRVEIDLIDHEIWLFLLDLLDDRALLPAGRTPGSSYIDEDRFAGCLGLLERLVVDCFPAGVGTEKNKKRPPAGGTKTQPEKGSQARPGKRCLVFGLLGLLSSFRLLH